MDVQIAAAARALATGDAFGALNRVALRDDAPALALRGIAMAQLGDLNRAKALMRKARRAFGAEDSLARARCAVAEAEIALAMRELNWPVKALDAARMTLESHGDWTNAAYARYLAVRRLLLIGRLDEAEHQLAALDPTPLPPALMAAYELVEAGIAIRRLQTKAARAALTRAEHCARQAGMPALMAEVESANLSLNTPAARLIRKGQERPLLLEEVEALLASDQLVVDACRNMIRAGQTTISLATRPVLFALARVLAEAWPADVARETLIRQVFRIKTADESHRVRLRVEIGRLRAVLGTLADLTATKQGYALAPHGQRQVVVLARPIEEPHAAILACLADGEAWSSSGLALALGISQRNVQRALDALSSTSKIQSFGRGRARRWITRPVPGFTTTLLLPSPLQLS